MKNIIYIIFIFSILNFVSSQTITNDYSMIDSSNETSNSITLFGASIGFATGAYMVLLAGLAGQDLSGLEVIAIFQDQVSLIVC